MSKLGVHNEGYTPAPIKLQILEDVPVEDKHGIKKGRVFALAKADRNGVWVKGDAGELVLLKPHEYTQYVEQTL